MGEGPGLVGLGRDLVEDQPAGFVDGDAALDEVVGKAALELELVREPLDRGDALPLLRVRLLVATQPVDFRKGHDGLAALVQASITATRPAKIAVVFIRALPGP